VVHRDLKPSNIMVAGDGSVKVLDFGLARPVDDAQGDTITVAGVLLGTPGYMSPEQATGDKVDERSDVFSLGVILFEMLTGTPCFSGNSTADMVRNVVMQEPSATAIAAAQLTPELEAVLLKCLRKDPRQRWANCGEMAHALRKAIAGERSSTHETTIAITPSLVRRRKRSSVRAAIAAALVVALLAIGVVWFRGRAPAEAQRGVAVLPFTSLQADAGAEAFSVGLVLAVSNALSGFEAFERAFWVVPASEMMQAKPRTAAEARQLFGVDLVVSGSVETGGDRVRVTANLTDARTRRQLRSRQITVSASDTFRLQDRLAEVAAELLELELPPAQRAARLRQSDGEPGAEDYLLQGQGYLQGGADNADAAIEVLSEAIRRDAKFAAPHAALSRAYVLKYDVSKDTEWLAKAKATATAAERLGGRTMESLQALSYIADAEGRYEESISLLRQVVDQEPRNAQAWVRLGIVYEHMHTPSQAEAAYRKAIELQPGYPGWHTRLGNFLYRASRYSEAEASFARAKDLAPDNYRAWAQLGAVNVQLARYDRAEEMLKQSIRLKPTFSAWANLASTYFFLNRMQEWDEANRNALALGPTSLSLRANTAHTYRITPMFRSRAPDAFREAVRLGESMLKVNSRDAETLAEMAWLYADLGQKDRAVEAMRQARDLAPKSGAVLFRAVMMWEALGDREQALLAYRLLRKTGGYVEDINRRPELAALRADPRFKGE
jgi:tetratricopeptide (TPR) repeat protein